MGCILWFAGRSPPVLSIIPSLGVLFTSCEKGKEFLDLGRGSEADLSLGLLLLNPAPLLLGGLLIGGADERSDIYIYNI